MSLSQESLRSNDAPGLVPPSSFSMVCALLCDDLRTLNARVAQEFFGLAALLQLNSARARQITAESHKATGSDANLKSSNSIGCCSGF